MATSKKATSKKVSTTATTKKAKATTKEIITAKAVGRNVIIVIGKDRLSKAFKEKADREAILAEVLAYNKRNSKTRLAKIIDTMSKNKKNLNKEIEKSAEAVKPEVVKPTKPKVNKVPTKQELEAAAALLEKHNYGKYAKQETVKNPTRRRYGEH